MENIKSSFFVKTLFSFLDEKIKLKIAKYNKKLQNNLDINIPYYMLFSDKYIIFDEKGEGKEYNSIYDYLTFEGGYLKGERNGKGKEYYNNGILKFEGEYLNGKRNGKGKEFHYYGKLEFEGEYLKGKRNGKGKEYNNDGYLIFEGEYMNGKKWNGKEYENSDLILELKDGKGYKNSKCFKGEYLNGERNGQGKEYNDNGQLLFEGEYHKGKEWSGKGYNNNKFIYELNEGKGYVKEYYKHLENTLRFEGEYLNGERSGKGKEYYTNDQLEYEGEYLNGNRHGKERNIILMVTYNLKVNI